MTSRVGQLQKSYHFVLIFPCFVLDSDALVEYWYLWFQPSMSKCPAGHVDFMQIKHTSIFF